jgi:hypothetical protein
MLDWDGCWILDGEWWIEIGIRGLLVADGDGGVPVGVKKEMPWIFPIQAGGLRLEG